MRDESCATCRFFESTGDIAFGECHRRAPVLNQHPQRADYRWPVTRGDDWCGEYVRDDDNDDDLDAI